MKKFWIGDLVEYKNKLHLVTGVQTNNQIGNEIYSYMYRLDGVNRWILDHFVYEV